MMTIKIGAALVVVCVAACLISVDSQSYGIASFFNPPYVPSACFGNQDQGVMVVLASDAFWNNGAGCGRYIEVTCRGPANGFPNPCRDSIIDVMIVGHCASPECQVDLILSEDAFSQIADPTAGIVAIQYGS